MMGKTWTALFVLVVLAVTSCAHPEEMRPDELAANTAKLYYQYLVDGKYEDFVAGLDRHIGQPEGYERQLADNAKMFVRQQQKLHQSIQRVRVASAIADKRAHTAMVYLVLDYGDDTSEQVVIPMVERDGLWLMR